MEFTNVGFKAFRADVESALKEVADKHQVTINCGNISYTDLDFTMKMKVVKNSTENGDGRKLLFERYCKMYGFEPTDYERVFYNASKGYKLVGFNLKSPKNCCSIIQVGTNKVYKCSTEFVKKGFLVS